jgi:hypothetical protein
MVPNVALRWIPLPQQIAPDVRHAQAGAGRGRSGGASQPASAGRPAAGLRTQSTVWVQDGDFVRPVVVTAGLSDGSMTEIQGDGISEGTAVVVGEAARNTADNETTNPFTPQFRARRS